MKQRLRSRRRSMVACFIGPQSVPQPAYPATDRALIVCATRKTTKHGIVNVPITLYRITAFIWEYNRNNV